MSLPDFVDAAIQSSQNYKRWIDAFNKAHPDHPKGYAEDTVLRVSKSRVPYCLELHVKRKIHDCSEVLIKADGIIYSTSQIEPVIFLEETRILRVKMRGMAHSILLDAHEVLVVSDLTFLINKTENWYRLHGQRMSLPSTRSDEIPEVHFPMSLSEEQLAARNLAMSEPLSYIWGAPGTGKTRAVLAACLYQYIANEQHVLLVAPTNNALDQSLIAVLDVLTAAGVSTDTVVRFGSPTAKLLEKYPQICASSEETYISEQESRRNVLQNVIRCRAGIVEAQKLLDDLAAIYNESDIVHIALGKISALKDELRRNNRSIERINIHISEKETDISRYSSHIEKLSKSIFYFFHRKQIENLKYLTDNTSRSVTALYSERKVYEDNIRSIKAALDSFGPCDISVVEKKMQNLISSDDVLASLASRGNGLLSPTTRTLFESELAERIDSLRHRIPDEFTGADTADLQAELAKIESNLKNMPEASESDESKKRYLCAATVDACISSLAPDSCGFDHVFMDEAGYCSLAKGAILLGYGAPLTLLGDHMQLPPICEVNEPALFKDRSDDLKYVSYWTQSALHIEECFSLSPTEIASRYFSGNDPDFVMLKNISLSKSYRFGSTLASILASEVYAPDFTGNENVSTEIYLVDSPAGKISNTDRTSAAEVFNAVRLAEKLTSQGDDFAILTPYRAQLNELNKRLPKLKSEEKILTIHASQGREWDTVILSVVDSSQNSPWFMNSTNRKSRGRQIVNTAISRARKRLIIVCEADFWDSRRNSQLIGKIIDKATPLKP